MLLLVKYYENSFIIITIIWITILNVFAVFGNPIKHSKSADIYALFANEMNIPNGYDLILAPEDRFDDMLFNFFNLGGLGANITVPFKERAVFLCDKLTERAMIARSVNTIKKQYDNTLLGDNTDGLGLINDLKRLNWIDQGNRIIHNIKKYDIDNHIDFIATSILLIGSGGAAKGIIPNLLNIKGGYINIVNRTFFKAKNLVHFYHRIGRQNISYINLDDFLYKCNKKKFDLIINATSSSMYNDLPNIPSSIITPSTKCYDLFYQQKDTVFIKWCKKYGSNFCSDGLGMLVEQAAYSFFLWHNKFPSTISAINYLQSTF